MNTSLARTASLLVNSRGYAARSQGGLSTTRHLRGVAFLLMFLFLTVGTIISVMRIADEYHGAVEKGQGISRTTARTAKVQAAQIIHEAALVTSGIADVYRSQSNPRSVDKKYIGAVLREKLALIPQVYAFFLVPDDGSPTTAAANFSVLPTFDISAETRRLNATTSSRFFVGSPLKGVDNANLERWFVPVGTYIGDADRPSGWVVALIDICEFEIFYDALKIGDHGRISLWTNEGQLVARTATVGLDVGTFDPNIKQVFSATGTLLANGDILVSSPGQNDSPNIVTKTQVDGLPLLIAVEMDDKDFLRDWRSTRNRLILTAIGIACAAFALTGIVLSQLQRTRVNEEALRTAKAIAEDANEAKSRFLAHMSHEFRTPLNAIMGFSDVIQTKAMGEPLAPIYATYAEHIYRSGEHLLEIVNDILDMAKIESGIQSPDLQPLDIATVINGAVAFLERMAGAFHLSVKVSIAPHLPRILGDERFVRQVLINLVSNAIKFSPAGRAVLVRAMMTKDGALDLSVIDHGHGIEPMILKRIGEPFLQGNPSLSRAGQGTGLGLSICKHYMDLLGGELLIDSTLGVGTTVTMRFPPELRAAEDNAAATPDSP